MSWLERFEIITCKEELTIPQIAKVIGKSIRKATEVRNDVIKFCDTKKIELPSDQIPTQLLLEHIGKTHKYFEDNARREIRLMKLKEEAGIEPKQNEQPSN